jgi:hypothetical protein
METHITYSKAEWAFVPKRFYFVKENANLDFVVSELSCIEDFIPPP